MVACNKLWLLAGWDPGHKQDGGDILADIWAMDLATNKWEEVILNVSRIRVLSSNPQLCSLLSRSAHTQPASSSS